MGWYTVIKTVKGRRYLYKQRTWREGKRVRTESVYVGPLDAHSPKKRKRKGVLRAIAGLIAANRTPKALVVDEQELLRYQEAREKERQAKLKALHAAYGLKMPAANPIPVEAHHPVMPSAAATAADSAPTATQQDAPEEQ